MKLGFKPRLFISILLLLVLSLSVTNWISYNNIHSNKLNEIESKSFLIVESSKTAIESLLKRYADTVESAVSAYASDSQDTNRSHNATANILLKAGGFNKVSISYFDGHFYGSALGDPYYFSRASNNTANEDWYQKAINMQDVLLTKINENEKDDGILLNIAAPFEDGVLSATLPIEVISGAINISHFKEATATVVDPDFKVFASTAPNIKPGSQNNIPNIEALIQQQEKGTFDYVDHGVDKRAYFTVVNTLGNEKWYLLINIDKKLAYAEVEASLQEALITSLIIILSASVAVMVLLRQLYRPILALKETIIDLSQGHGDLTRRLEIRSQDDLGQIAGGVNTFIANLQQMMMEVKQSTQHISDGVNQIHTQSGINNTLIQAHVEETSQVVTAVSNMNDSAEAVAGNATHAASFTLQANKEALASKGVVTSAVDSVTSLIQEVESMEGGIQSMDELSKEISSTLNVIGEIADQTNLLALNAAIEAARAGEQGRGFSIVADEVRRLAAKTQQSTVEISDKLSKLANGSELIVAAMDNTKYKCKQAAENTAQIHDSLDVMTTSVSEINNSNTQIAHSAETQRNVAKEIHRNMNTISQMVTELSANAEITVSSTQSLATTNTQLEGIVNQFKLA